MSDGFEIGMGRKAGQMNEDGDDLAYWLLHLVRKGTVLQS